MIGSETEEATGRALSQEGGVGLERSLLRGRQQVGQSRQGHASGKEVNEG